jgi:hypothetical protein
LTVRIITTCTDRKRLKVEDRLRARDLPRAPIEALAQEWRKRVDASAIKDIASKVYGGRSFQEALTASSVVGTELLVISAGLGLVRASQRVPAYALTVVRGADDDISVKCEGRFDASEWWTLANARRNTISHHVKREQNDLFILGLSRPYVGLVEEDLLALGDADRSRIRIVGLSVGDHLPQELQGSVLPYDSRLDGPNSLWRGTRSDFASRAIRHFVEVILPKVGMAPVYQHNAAVSEAMASWDRPQNVLRKKCSDDEILSLIQARLESVGQSSSRMLRHLRDVDAIACEQTRFKNLFKRAVSERAL